MAIPSRPQIGDRFKLGKWGGERIEWRVLDVRDGRALAISCDVLDAGMFNDTLSKGNVWETSELKEWIEGIFVPGAFSEQQRAAICEAGCLSVEEARNLFADDHDRICFPTPYAVRQGVFKAGEFRGHPEFGCYWWLRSPGAMDFHYAAYVADDGRIHDAGNFIRTEFNGIRPALWLSL